MTTKTARRGAAFLLTVVVLLIVVVVAMQGLVTGEVSVRRSETGRSRAATLQQAIDTSLASELGPGPTRLPVDSDNGVWIEIVADGEQVTAKWLVGERVQDQIVRPLPQPQ